MHLKRSNDYFVYRSAHIRPDPQPHKFNPKAMFVVDSKHHQERQSSSNQQVLKVQINYFFDDEAEDNEAFLGMEFDVYLIMAVTTLAFAAWLFLWAVYFIVYYLC